MRYTTVILLIIQVSFLSDYILIRSAKKVQVAYEAADQKAKEAEIYY